MSDENTPTPDAGGTGPTHRLLLFLAVLVVVVLLVVYGHFTTADVVAVLGALGTLYGLLRE